MLLISQNNFTVKNKSSNLLNLNNKYLSLSILTFIFNISVFSIRGFILWDNSLFIELNLLYGSAILSEKDFLSSEEIDFFFLGYFCLFLLILLLFTEFWFEFKFKFLKLFKIILLILSIFVFKIILLLLYYYYYFLFQYLYYLY